MCQPDLYYVVGDPVTHSLSPTIHLLFAEQCHQQIRYQKKQVLAGTFSMALAQSKAQGVKGLNVTLPLKHEAFQCADITSNAAEQAQAVSYLHVRDDGTVYGDNLDGMGMIWAMQRRHEITLAGKQILIAGAGGAVQGVLGAVLQQQPRQVVIANRTVKKAIDLARRFQSYGSVVACGYSEINHVFDIVINGTSASINQQVPPIPTMALHKNSFCYDMMYNLKQDTAFIAWAKRQGCQHVADGIGMLVEQNAEIFKIWRGIEPETNAVYQKLGVKP